MRKKIFTLITCLIFIMSFVACTNDTDPLANVEINQNPLDEEYILPSK